jgi:hypothetical protein
MFDTPRVRPRPPPKCAEIPGDAGGQGAGRGDLRRGRAAAKLALLALLVATGCSATHENPPVAGHAGGPAAPPDRAKDCNHLLPIGPDGPSIVAGFHWTGETHKFGVAAALYACVSPHQGRSVVFTAVPAGVTVTPAEKPVDPDGSGVERFAVVVQRGVAGRVWLQQLDNGVGSASVGGPRIVAGASGWHFAAGT